MCNRGFPLGFALVFSRCTLYRSYNSGTRFYVFLVPLSPFLSLCESILNSIQSRFSDGDRRIVSDSYFLSLFLVNERNRKRKVFSASWKSSFERGKLFALLRWNFVYQSITVTCPLMLIGKH